MEKTGYELKSDQLKSLISACPVGLATAHKSAHGRTISENPLAIHGPYHQGKPGLKHPDAFSPKSCMTGKGNIHCHTAQQTYYMKGQRH
jgi:hypothetical protein